MDSGYAPVNGLKMYYEIHGRDDGSPPLVLLHGGGSTVETSFGGLLPHLGGRRVIAFEQQGHGRTADVDRPFDFAQSADDTAALLRHLKIPQADFLGYSNGGHILLELGRRHPSIIRKLIIESAMFTRDGADPRFWDGFKDPKLESMPKELQEAYRKTAPDPSKLQSFFDKSVERMRTFQGWRDEDLKAMSMPVLVLAGDHDILTPEHAVRMYRLFPKAELAILPATDHMEIVKRGAWVASMTEEFLNR
jgi:pimeloyl-ACP methyl ester carboxylesterase